MKISTPSIIGFVILMVFFLLLLSIYIINVALRAQRNHTDKHYFSTIQNFMRNLILSANQGAILVNSTKEVSIARIHQNDEMLFAKKQFSRPLVKEGSSFVHLLMGDSQQNNLLDANNLLASETLSDKHLQQATRLAQTVREWITDDSRDQIFADKTLSRRLVFNDVILEKQFSFYFLYVHLVHVRVAVLVLLGFFFVTLPFTTGAEGDLSTRVTCAVLLLASLPLTSRRNLEKGFFFVDWGISFTAFTGSIALHVMLRYDLILNSNYNPSDEKRLVIYSQFYVLFWIFVTGTIWARKVLFVLPHYISFVLLNSYVKSDQTTAGEAEEVVGFFKNSQTEITYLLYLILAMYVNRVIELHHRVHFNRSWVLAKRRHDAEEALMKKKFTDEQVEIIRQVMENRDEEIDEELQECLIDSDDIDLEEIIGKGAYGEVFKGSYEGIHVAVKVMKDITEEALMRTRAEILLIKGLQHDCIVLFLGACWDEYLMGIVLELVENGPLAGFLYNKKLHLSWQHPKLSMAKDAASGCHYLHQCTYFDEKERNWHECIIHRDLKPDNMLVTTTYGIKLTDFGEARSLSSETTMTQVGSPVYMAPEILRGERYDERVDIYSYAITLTEMLVLSDTIFDVFDTKYKKMHGGNSLTALNLTKAVAIQNFRPDIPDTVFPSLKKLICACWHNDPNRRPSFEEIMLTLDNEVHLEVFNDVVANELSEHLNVSHRNSNLRERRKIGNSRSGRHFSGRQLSGRQIELSGRRSEAKTETETETETESETKAEALNNSERSFFSKSSFHSTCSVGTTDKRGQHLKKMMSKRINTKKGPDGTFTSTRPGIMNDMGGTSLRGDFGGGSPNVSGHSPNVANRGRRASLGFTPLSVGLMHAQRNEGEAGGGGGERVTSLPGAVEEVEEVEEVEVGEAVKEEVNGDNFVNKKSHDNLIQENEQLKRQLAEKESIIIHSQLQLKLAKKNAKQARLDMAEKRHQSFGIGRTTSDDDDQNVLAAALEAKRDFNNSNINNGAESRPERARRQTAKQVLMNAVGLNDK